MATPLSSTVAAQTVLSVSATSVSSQANAGGNAPSQTVRVSNAGRGALKWSVVRSNPLESWFSVSPTSGVNTGTLTIAFNTVALTPGTYQGTFRVQVQGSTTSVTVSVLATIVNSAPTLTVTCPSNISLPSSNGSAVVVTYSVTTSGGVAPIMVTGSPASGSSFPVGTTSVTVNVASSDGQNASCVFSVTVSNSPPPSGSTVGPQPTITCPANAVDIQAGTFINAVVDAYPGGTTFCLRAGIHYLDRSIVPKTGDAFVGEYGAILHGTWTSNDDTQAAFRAHQQDIDGVTIRNLVIRNFRQGIHAYAQWSDHWTIEFNEIASNYSGIVFPSDSIIRNNYIHHNFNHGYQGLYSHNSTIENNEIANNGWQQKVMESNNVTFRNNFVHHNEGTGIWYDANNTGALIEGNRVEDNGSAGVWYEISGNVIIRNNAIRRSLETGIFIAMSKDADIYNNTLEGNFRGITYFLNCPSIGGGVIGFDLANNSAHDNRIVVDSRSGALASAFSYTGSCTSTQLAPYQNGLKNITFSHNNYDVPLPDTGAYWWLWDGPMSWSAWQALGHDPMSTAD